MYAAMLLNVAGIPFGAGAVVSAVGAWVVVAGLLASALVLSACAERRPRLGLPDRARRWLATSRPQEGFWSFRVRCAEVTVKNA